ncbi:hypothetical protein HS088_TW06G01231 [Tripterygium wilfordii]|uniref:EF-hand domain-containing protein n=1 Tax=Tripterygium wilfordii TaxID=458696 RepID=A0A7J7DLF2_TRIWF|nr:hypothetical protein HS088_TW06G01231 [Tripterygium wilfordii]
MPSFIMEDKSAGENVIKDELKTIFREHIDGDGKISKHELKKAFKKLGSRLPGWRSRSALKYADTDGDGSISICEIDYLVKYAVSFGYKLQH